MNVELTVDKKELRRQTKERLKALNVDRASAADSLYANLMTIPKVISARTIAVFVDFGTEISTRRFIPQLFIAKEFTRTVGVPFCTDGEMNFYKLLPPTLDPQTKEPFFNDLVPMAFGILEPRTELRNIPENILAPEDIDVVITPGLAFDLRGGRLGRGAGYYDKFLPKIRPDALAIGICYEEQIVERAPTDAHDFRVHAIATPKRVVFSR
jgi:5-formyltetrahydrofolate cyclo-ligase